MRYPKENFDILTCLQDKYIHVHRTLKIKKKTEIIFLENIFEFLMFFHTGNLMQKCNFFHEKSHFLHFSILTCMKFLNVFPFLKNSKNYFHLHFKLHI